jgi:release factor glutamine methyltransferase
MNKIVRKFVLVTYKEAEIYINSSIQKLFESGEAQAIAQRIMEFLTGIEPSQKYKAEKISILPEQVSLIDKIVERVINGEPLQYILQEQWFCGCKFYVDSRVLIPRPETEELVEWIISDCKFPIDNLSILDIGTGSGCIPISLKRRLRKAIVFALDISNPALEVARLNAKNIGAAIDFIEADILKKDTWKQLPKADIITSNPPYVMEMEKTQMKDQVTKHEPSLALFVPNNDPLIFYKALALAGKDILNKDGKIFVEINETLGNETAAIFKEAGYTTELKKDMQGKERMLKASLT